jgi:hypothetical protein
MGVNVLADCEPIMKVFTSREMQIIAFHTQAMVKTLQKFGKSP